MRRPSLVGVALSNRRITDEDLRAAGVPDPDAARRTAGSPVLVFDPAPEDTDPAAQWLTQLYQSVKPPSGQGKLLWHVLGAKTVELIHQNVHVEAAARHSHPPSRSSSSSSMPK